MLSFWCCHWANVGLTNPFKVNGGLCEWRVCQAKWDWSNKAEVDETNFFRFRLKLTVSEADSDSSRVYCFAERGKPSHHRLTGGEFCLHKRDDDEEVNPDAASWDCQGP
jgi:hypothetical protein